MHTRHISRLENFSNKLTRQRNYCCTGGKRFAGKATFSSRFLADFFLWNSSVQEIWSLELMDSRERFGGNFYKALLHSPWTMKKYKLAFFLHLLNKIKKCYKTLKDHLEISLLILSEFKRINYIFWE